MKTNTNSKAHNLFYEPHTPWKKIPLNHFKLPSKYSFDLDAVRKQVDEITNQHGLHPYPLKLGKHDYNSKTYHGICFTARPGVSSPLTDGLVVRQSGSSEPLETKKVFLDKKEGVSSPSTIDESEFTEKTSIYSGYIGSVLDRFASPKTKVRLISMLPGGSLDFHVDFPYYQQVRLHAAIYTNPSCFWEVDGEVFQIPADGNFYWLDAGKPHRAWNDGSTQRLLLSVNLRVFIDRDGSPLRPPEEDLITVIENGLI